MTLHDTNFSSYNPSSGRGSKNHAGCQALARANAALKIQRAWRAAALRNTYLKPDVLWSDLTAHAQLKVGALLLR